MALKSLDGAILGHNTGTDAIHLRILSIDPKGVDK
jgi:hypothetical protein